MSILMLAAAACISVPDYAPTMQAAGKPWYDGNAVITVLRHKYAKEGRARAYKPGELVFLDTYKDTAVAVEPGAPTVELAYVLVDMAKCEFQPYRLTD